MNLGEGATLLAIARNAEDLADAEEVGGTNGNGAASGGPMATATGPLRPRV